MNTTDNTLNCVKFTSNPNANPQSWNIISGALPPGTQIDSVDGYTAYLMGTPDQTGTYTFAFENTGTVSPFTYTVYEITASTQSPVTATLNTPIEPITFSRSNSAPTTDIRWTIIGSYLPSGFNINQMSGVFTGTPSAVGKFAFYVADMSAYNNGLGSMPFRIDVPGIIATPSPPQPFNVNASFSVQFTDESGSTSGLSVSGTPPGSTTFNTSTGVLGGQILARGGYLVTITDEGSRQLEYLITVVENIIADPSSPYLVLVNTPMSVQFSYQLSGDVAGLVASGLLSDMQFDSTTGILRGQFATPGTRTVTISGDQYTAPLVYQIEVRSDQPVLCLHPMSRVRTSTGIKPIEQIYAGEVCYTLDSQPLCIGANIRFAPTTRFTLVSRGALSTDGIELPTNDLYITAGHPILLGGKEVDPVTLHNGTSIRPVVLDDPVNVYTLCTKQRTTCEVEGLMVLTYEIRDFLLTADTNGIEYTMQ